MFQPSADTLSRINSSVSKRYVLLSLVFTFLFLMLIVPSQVLAGCTYVDPRSSMSGYFDWCRCMSGTPYNDSRGVGCIRGGSSGYGGGSNPFDPLFRPLGEALGEALGNLIKDLFSGPSSEELAAKRREIEDARHQEEEAKKI